MDIEFSIKTKYGNYNDTLSFPDGVTPTEAEIKKLKQERINKWVSHFSPNRPAPELDKETVTALSSTRLAAWLAARPTPPKLPENT